MAVDDQMLRRYLPWGLPLESGFGYKLTPRPDEPVYVTGVHLLDSASAVGQGAVDARVHTDTRDLGSALLSAENPRVELERPVRLELGNECCFHVVPHGDDSNAEADTDADADPDADRVIVMFEGFLVTPQPLDTEEEDDEAEEKKEETGSDDDEYGEKEDEDDAEEEEEETGSDEGEYGEKEEGETDGEVDQDVARVSSAGGNAKELRQVVAITMAFLGILLSVSMLAFLGLIM